MIITPEAETITPVEEIPEAEMTILVEEIPEAETTIDVYKRQDETWLVYH